jgi:hypothetical protein
MNYYSEVYEEKFLQFSVFNTDLKINFNLSFDRGHYRFRIIQIGSFSIFKCLLAGFVELILYIYPVNGDSIEKVDNVDNMV